MKKKNSYTYIVLVAIFFAALSIRLLPVVTYDNPIGIDAYYHIRITEYTLSNGLMVYDPLSFGGRQHLYPPGMHVMLAAFSILFQAPVEIVAQIIPTIIGAFSIVLVFLISKKMHTDDKIALLSAFLLAFVPVHIWKTSSNVLTSAVDMTILLAAVYFLLNKDYLKYLLSVLILAIFSPFIAFFAVLLGVSGTNILEKGTRYRKLIFGVFIAALIFFVALFPVFGSVYVTKDLPPELSSDMYSKDLSTLIKLNPLLILGILGIIKARRDPRIRRTTRLDATNLFVFWVLVNTALIIFNFIETDRGLFYLAVPLSMYSAYILLTANFAVYKKLKTLALLFVVFLSAYIGFMSLGGLSWSAVSHDERDALLWIRDNTPENSTVLGTLFEGHWISGIAERRNVIDGNLIGAPQLKERFGDVKSIYTTMDESLRQSLIEKYGIDYILFSGWAYQLGGSQENFAYATVFQEGIVRVYQAT